MFAIGNIISPQTFQARDAPEYRPAKISVMATQAGSALTTFFLFLYYVWQNRKRGLVGKSAREEESCMDDDPQAWAGMTDRENKKFKYSY